MGTHFKLVTNECLGTKNWEMGLQNTVNFGNVASSFVRKLMVLRTPIWINNILMKLV